MAIRFYPLLTAAILATACSSTRPAADAPGRVSRVEGPTTDAQPAGTKASSKPPAATGSAAEAPASAPGSAIEAVRGLWQARRPLAAGREAALRDRVKVEPRFKKAMTTTLDARGWEFFFSSAAGPTAALDAILAAVRALPEHGLKTDGYPLDALTAAVERLRSASGEAATARTVLEQTPGWAAVKDLVERRDVPTDAEVAGLEKAGRLGGMDGDAWKALAQAFARSLDGERGLDSVRAEVEVPAMVAFFRYALDMKLLVVASPFKADKDPAGADVTHHDALVAAFDAFARNPKDGLAALCPQHPYYAALQKGLAEYRRLAAAGPFEEVKFKGKLKRGARGEAVLAVQKRLAQEGYFEGQADGIFGEALEKAVIAYQEAHGFNGDGILEERHQKSLNVQPDERVKQIELGLQRWRESEVRPEEPLYVRVNIPEFRMEVWEDGKIAMKHRVVTGNNKWDKDTDNRLEGRINRTKIFTAQIQKVLLNPKWHVPGRIQREEINYEVLKDPEYLAKHRFQVKVLPDGREQVTQQSGGANALGRVKFVFPNPYGIFMHDTPLKEFFKREIRAFSHGCVRLQDPLEVAYYLLEKAAGMERERAEELLGTFEQKEIELDRKIPIFVEYNSVGVDANGRVEFYSDVYGYDKDFFEGRIPYGEDEINLLMRRIPKGA